MSTNPLQVTVRELERGELSTAAELLGRGMRDNPINVRAFGQDAEQRRRALTRFFKPVLRGAYRRGSVFGAIFGETLVGVYVAAPPGRCQPNLLEKLRVFPSVFLGNAFATSLRVMRWAGEWSRRDAPEPHWHLGPVAVDAHLKGQGVGSAMMTNFCWRMNGQSAMSYLETDRLENVRFYEMFGFNVLGEARILGVQNWFMSRPSWPE